MSGELDDPESPEYPKYNKSWSNVWILFESKSDVKWKNRNQVD